MFEKIIAFVNEVKSKRTSNMVVINTLIGEQTEIIGDIKIDGNLKLDGKLVGNIEATGDVIIGEKAEVKGNILSQSIIVSGLVEGDILTKEQFTITSTATVRGDITTHGFVVDIGSHFIGNCKIIEDEEGQPVSLQIDEETQVI